MKFWGNSHQRLIYHVYHSAGSTRFRRTKHLGCQCNLRSLLLKFNPYVITISHYRITPTSPCPVLRSLPFSRPALLAHSRKVSHTVTFDSHRDIPMTRGNAHYNPPWNIGNLAVPCGSTCLHQPVTSPCYSLVHEDGASLFPYWVITGRVSLLGMLACPRLPPRHFFCSEKYLQCRDSPCLPWIPPSFLSPSV